MAYTVNVIGTLWQGCDGSYSYSAFGVPTREEVQQLAGDFALVQDYEVIKRTSTMEKTAKGSRHTTETETIKEWDNPDSAEIFSRM